MWNCNISLERGNTAVEVTFKGDVIPDLNIMREQVVVLAEEYDLGLIEQTLSDWVTPTSSPGVFVRHIRVAAYQRTRLDVYDTDDGVENAA